jgi:hypothetical protein
MLWMRYGLLVVCALSGSSVCKRETGDWAVLFCWPSLDLDGWHKFEAIAFHTSRA